MLVNNSPIWTCNRAPKPAASYRAQVNLPELEVPQPLVAKVES